MSRPYRAPRVGDRVICATDPDHQHGTVAEVVRQRHADDLVSVSWDLSPDDRDLYSMAVVEYAEVIA